MRVRTEWQALWWMGIGGALMNINGCTATVPPEVVALSYQMESDIDAIEQSHLALIEQHVVLLREQRERYLQDEWIPMFIATWVEEGQLLAMAQGSKVYDEAQQRFVTVSELDRKAQGRSIALWATEASYVIDEKRQSLFAPLDEAEQQLRSHVQSAFKQLKRSNQAVTAHLNSVRAVQQTQESVLAQAEWQNARSQLSEALSSLSQHAQQGLEKIRQADKKVARLGEQP